MQERTNFKCISLMHFVNFRRLIHDITSENSCTRCQSFPLSLTSLDLDSFALLQYIQTFQILLKDIKDKEVNKCVNKSTPKLEGHSSDLILCARQRRSSTHNVLRCTALCTQAHALWHRAVHTQHAGCTFIYS